MRRPSNYLSGRTKVTSPSDVSADRHSFLSLGEAEPNLGVPSATEAIVLSDTSGVRTFVNLSSDFDVLNGEIKLVANTAQFAVSANVTLQTVTDTGNTTTNDITLDGSNLIFDTGTYETKLAAVTTTTTNKTITLPDATGTVITTGNLSNIGDTLGSVFYGNDAVANNSYQYVVHTSGGQTIKLSTEDALAGLILVDEAVDATQNADYNILMVQTEGLGTASGSPTAARATMVDGGGITFNPNTNLVKTSGAYVANGLSFLPAISTPQANQSLKLFANGSGDIQILKLAKFGNSIIVLDEDENGLIFDTNNDSGSVIHYNTAANTAAADIQSGVEYQIITGGTTDFTLIGAADSLRGTTFTATGAGTGTGLVVTTSTVKQAFFGWDRSDNKFKWIPDGTLTGTGSINTTFAGDVGDAEFANLTLTGDLTVQGNTVTVNAETLSIEDPLIFIGTANNSTDDGKDRGIVFDYNDGTNPQTGFIGYDNSADEFVLQKKGISVSNDVVTVSGFASDLGDIRVGEINSIGKSKLGSSILSGRAVEIGASSSSQRLNISMGVTSTAGYGSTAGTIISNERVFGSSTRDLLIHTQENQAILLSDVNEEVSLFANNNVILSGNTTYIEIPNKLVVTDTGLSSSASAGGGAAHFLGSVAVNSTFFAGGSVILNEDVSGPSTTMGTTIQGHIRFGSIGGSGNKVAVIAKHGTFGAGQNLFEPGLDLVAENLTHGTNGIRIAKDGTVSIDQTLITTALSSNTAGLAIEGQTFPGSVGSTGQVLLVANSATGALAWGNVPPSGITELLDDTTPQLGGDLDTNGKNINVTNQTSAIMFNGGSGQIFHNTTGNGTFTITSGDKISIDANALSGFVIENSANTQKFIDGSVNNPVNLYYKNSKKLETSNTGITITGDLQSDTATIASIPFSTSGAQSIIDKNGALNIRGNWIRFQKPGTNTDLAIMKPDGEVELYHNGSQKLETTTDGVEVTGTLTATAKSFLIDHPTKEGMKLKHGSLEGPENGVYVRGHLVGTNGEIKLPDYWEGLVDKETITVNITPIGRHQKLYVKDIINNTVFIGNENLFNKQINCYYTIYGERKDIDKLVVEYDAK